MGLFSWVEIRGGERIGDFRDGMSGGAAFSKISGPTILDQGMDAHRHSREGRT
jgi:hypothetical protein